MRSARNEENKPERRRRLEERLNKLGGGSAPAQDRSGPPARAGRARGRGTSKPGGPRRGAIAYLLLDCSYSMSGDKIVRAREGARAFTSRALEKGYRVGAISFSAEASLLSEPAGDAQEISEALEGQILSGGTNISAALELSLTRLQQEWWKVAAVIVATDGYPYPPDHPERALAAARKLKDAGVSVLTIGTEDADQRFLKELASATDLATPTTSERLGAAIEGAAKNLPQLPGSGDGA